MHRDGHVEVAKAYYSVPPEYLGRELWARWDARLVRIFNHRWEQVAIQGIKRRGQKCRDKTGLEWGMKESYEEDLASRFGLQRRAGYGNVSGLSVRAEGSAGQPLSSEIITSVCRPCSDRGKAMPRASSWARRSRTRRSLRT